MACVSHADPQLPEADPHHTVAAVDLGTQTALLTIVRFDARGVPEVVEDHAFLARLGAGLSSDGTLAATSRERTREVLATFARRIALHGVPAGRVRVVGTAVLRRARDARAFVDEVRHTCGLSIDVVDGAEEARLSWLGATEFTPNDLRYDALVDVGGGSAELVGPGGVFLGSLEIGGVWSTERFAARPAVGEYDEVGWEARERHVLAAVATLPVRAASTPVAVGGGAVNLASLVRGARAFDHRLADGTRVEHGAVCALARRLARLSHEERLDLPIEAQRAAVLPAGLFAIGALVRHLGAAAVYTTGRGLRHGVALELVRAARRETHS
jgi:exopolyphosphatase/guanosine-5'-triphosphate,3'-diphosphate pyrophosphatase